MDKKEFQEKLLEKGISLSSDQMAQFELYFETLIDWNEKINLTAITEKEEVYLKHFYDSLTAAFHFDFTKQKHVCDVGAGAGFPSIPLKIAFPHLHVTIVDSLKKRITFLQQLADVLHLKNVQFIHDRAETFGQRPEYREKFDLVTARAVAKMSVLTELCLPLVKVNGMFLAMKGASGQEELSQAKKAISLLGGKVLKVKEFSLPVEDSARTIIQVAKVKRTPKRYPRKPGTPNRSPLE